MKTYTNIEKSAFVKGHYVGYANGVWHIERYGRRWMARHREFRHLPVIADTLAELSSKLTAVAEHC